MDLSFQIIFAFLIFFFMFLKITTRTPSGLPPGPWKLPIIGSIHHLGISSFPHQRFRDLAKKYGPLMYIQLGQLSIVVVSTPETAKEVMKTHDLNFSDRPNIYAVNVILNGGKNITFSPHGDYWRWARRICSQELLSPLQVQSFSSAREEEVSKFIKSIKENVGLPVDITERIFSLSYGLISRAAFGKKCRDEEAFIDIVKEATVAAAGFNISDLFPSYTFLPVVTGFKTKVEKIRDRFDVIVDNIIKDHKAKKVTTNASDEDEDEDLVDVLLRFQELGEADFPLPTANIKGIIMVRKFELIEFLFLVTGTAWLDRYIEAKMSPHPLIDCGKQYLAHNPRKADMFVAGSETSSLIFEWAISEMMKHPKIMEKAQTEVRNVVNRRGRIDATCIQELVFVKLIIKETLRLHPISLFVPRESKEKCEINGYEIPAKCNIFLNLWAINRDPKWWKDPEKFDPERFLNSSTDFKGLDFEYLPFGGGRRVCPGMTFALPNIELPLVKMLYHFDWKLPDGITSENLDMNESFGLTIKRKHDLTLIPTAYYP